MEMIDNTVVALPPKLNSTDWVERYKNGNFDISPERLAAELQLLALGDFVPLSIKIDTWLFETQVQQFNNDWFPYLPRTDRLNNREALTVVTYPGFSHAQAPSMPQIQAALGRPVLESDCNVKTSVYEACTSLHPILNLFPDLGRTFLVKCNMGGYFVPHRDHPQLSRDVFRIIVFLKNCKRFEYDFLFDDKSLEIEEGRAYMVNTRRTHRTMSFVDDSIHLILNIPLTLENVLKIVSNLQHRH